MKDDIEIIDSITIATKIKYQGRIWIPENERAKETSNLSSEKIRCWIRFKNIKQFTLDDLREAFPEWDRYAKSQLLFKLFKLIKNNSIQQLPNDEFKVLKL